MTATKTKQPKRETPAKVPRPDVARQALAQDNLVLAHAETITIKPVGDAADPTTAAGQRINETGFPVGERIPWPLDKLTFHPLNRDIDPDHVKRLQGLLTEEGQLDAVEVRVPPAWWSHRSDRDAVPIGHLQVLRGAHRCTAARRLKWSKIDVRIRSHVTDAEAEVTLARSDNQKQWSYFDRGRLAAAMQARGETLTAIAQHFGIADKGAVSHLIGITGLPAKWRELVEPGLRRKRRHGAGGEPGDLVQVPPSWLRPLEKFPAEILDALYDEFYESEIEDGWPGRWTRSKSSFAQAVAAAVDSLGPIDHKPFSTWVASAGRHGGSKRYGRLFELTEEVERDLKIVEIDAPSSNGKKPAKGGPKRIRVATNVALYNKLQAPREQLFREGKIDAAGREVKAKKTKAKAKPEKETKRQREARLKREAVEAAAKKKEAAKVLRKRLAAWRLRWLRLAASHVLAPEAQLGDYRVVPLLLHLLGHARSPVNSWRGEPCPVATLTDTARAVMERRQGTDAEPKKQGRAQRRKKPQLKGDGVAALVAAMSDGREDEVTAALDLQVTLLRLMLWPQCDELAVPYLVAGPGELPTDFRSRTRRDREKQKPVDLLTIEPADVEQVAAVLKVSNADAWKRSAKQGTQERLLVRELLELHTRDQLDRLARELLAKRANGEAGEVAKQPTLSHAISCLFAYHTAAAPFLLPKLLRSTK